MTNLAAEFPKNLGISITAGTTELTHAQAKTILPAAINLLPLFHDDKRPVPGRRCVHLVRAFVRRQHPDWRYNNTMTLTLWALPAGAANVKLKVGIMLILLGLHALHIFWLPLLIMLHLRHKCVLAPGTFRSLSKVGNFASLDLLFILPSTFCMR